MRRWKRRAPATPAAASRWSPRSAQPRAAFLAAAKDNKDLISNSSNQVKEGVDLVNRAGSSLKEIVESIKQVSEIITDIATASVEQATGLDQINRRLNQMDEGTQQNSALVEENAAYAKTLETQSRAMDQLVGFFQLEDKWPHLHAGSLRRRAA